LRQVVEGQALPVHVSLSHHTFLEQAAAEEWDRIAYAPGTYDSFIWELEQAVLLPAVEALRERVAQPKYLDFACGTGRVLRALEPYCGQVHGVDVSPVMVRGASIKAPQASIRLGDLLVQPYLADFDYDLITAFRFFLNAEPELRYPYLADLASRLRDGQSRLIFNVHANARGMDGVAARLEPSRVMSPGHVIRLVGKAGLEVVGWHGIGLMPACRHRLRALRRPMRGLDRRLASRGWLRPVSRDLLFICRRRRENG